MMETQLEAASSFVLEEGEGRTQEALNIMGQTTLVKLAGSDTGGNAAVFHLTVPPMSGPPLHRHSREDEWFYVLQGSITVEIDGARCVLKPGGSAFALRGTVHAFQNFTSETGMILVMTTPGTEFNKFFVAISAHNMGLAAPDLPGSVQIMMEHGIEMMGPPLS
jgi:quercetin dioxygenase-like cupin family protein